MSKDRTDKIVKIAKHFADMIPGDNGDIPNIHRNIFFLVMDIKCVDKMHKLALDSMLDDLDSVHVAHDVFGIYRYLDRETKQLTEGWTPRFGRA